MLMFVRSIGANMSFTTSLQEYTRAPAPALPESQLKYLQEELRKLEMTLRTITEALKELDQRYP
jgi:hypothetical protein